MKYNSVLIGVLMMACAEKPKDPAEVIYTNASIWTGVAEAPRAEALAIARGEILAIGSKQEVDHYKNKNTRLVDLGGKFVTPGFMDVHTHFMSGGFQLASVDLRTAASPEEFSYRVGQFAKFIPAERWILGGDWDHENLGGELPQRQWLDRLTPDHFVFVNRLDGHMALMYSLIPEPSAIERDEAFARATDFAVARGVTQVHDMGSWADLETYRRAQQREPMKLRIYSLVPLSTRTLLLCAIGSSPLILPACMWWCMPSATVPMIGCCRCFRMPYAKTANVIAAFASSTRSILPVPRWRALPSWG